tara:strand:- start:29133 stop:29780 length:648 start_codon:yes stop_codon:yes gene_type:complete
MARFGFGNHRNDTGNVDSAPDLSATPDTLPISDRLSLLIVDENEAAREAMAHRFSYMKYDVQLAENGATAVTMLAAHRFDVILVDFDMQLISGSETIRRVRVSGMIGSASILSVAPFNNSRAEMDALGAGADEHIAKPFDFDVINIRMRHIVQRARKIEELAHYNEVLDARIARRAMELGETRAELEELRADRGRLVSSIQALYDEIERLTPPPA